MICFSQSREWVPGAAFLLLLAAARIAVAGDFTSTCASECFEDQANPSSNFSFRRCRPESGCNSATIHLMVHFFPAFTIHYQTQKPFKNQPKEFIQYTRKGDMLSISSTSSCDDLWADQAQSSAIYKTIISATVSRIRRASYSSKHGVTSGQTRRSRQQTGSVPG